MNWKPLVQRVLLLLLTAALLLPATALVLVGLGWLLTRMGDAAGMILERLALAAGVLWVLDLLFLILVQAFHLLLPPGEPPEA